MQGAATFHQSRVTNVKHAFIEVRSLRVEDDCCFCLDNGEFLKRVPDFFEPVHRCLPKAVKASFILGNECHAHALLNKEGAELLIGMLELQAAEDDDPFFVTALIAERLPLPEILEDDFFH